MYSNRRTSTHGENIGHILFCISSHGYGHAVRQAFLINHIPASFTVSIFSGIAEAFFLEELERPFSLYSHTFDCGAIQHDALTIDIEQTLERYAFLHTQNREQLPDLVEWCRAEKITAIVSDAVPFASVLADALAVPSIFVSNFTWLDIYQDFPPSVQRDHVLTLLKAELSLFSAWVKLTPFSGNDFVPPLEIPLLENVSLLRAGRNRRDELRERLNLDAHTNTKIALIYSGVYGFEKADWTKLDSFEGWHFIGLHAPTGELRNFTPISKNDFTLQDYSASSDLIISKLGYGTVSESLSSGVPFLYIPREDFSESAVLEAFMHTYGGVYRIEKDAFYTLDWGDALHTLGQVPRRDTILQTSLEEIAQWIYQIILSK